jgi:hypothetical protein
MREREGEMGRKGVRERDGERERGERCDFLVPDVYARVCSYRQCWASKCRGL